MELYFDLIQRIPEFGSYDTMGEDIYIECKVSPLGTLGHWLNELAKDTKSNEALISRVCGWLNSVYKESGNYSCDVRNDFGVYLFWALDYSTINYIKKHLDPQMLFDGRAYLKAIDRDNYRDF